MQTRTAIALTLATLVTGCATGGPTREDLSQQIRQRTGASLRPQSASTGFEMAPGVQLGDGLSQRECVALALYNNAALQADLVQLDVSRADLTEAALLPNPFLSLVLPLGPRQLASYINLPIDWIWQRPRRIALAERELSRVATGLVQNGLDVARDAQIAWIDTQIATLREALLTRGATMLAQSRDIAGVRLQAGDIAPGDVAGFESDAAMGAARAAQSRAEITASFARLRQATGLPMDQSPSLSALETSTQPLPDASTLLRRALAGRPDLRAAEIAIESASERVGWERSRAWSLIAVLDGGGNSAQGFGISPGFRAEIPLFSRNQGGIGRAEAELQRAAWRYVAARQLIERELTTALAAHTQALAALQVIETAELPAAERLVALTRASYEGGDVAYFALLDAQRRWIDSQLRALDARATVLRAQVEVARAIGGSL
ncbi:MAG: TolC family protein [Deltaproteobacteria bacterium]|nr:TolC family protein [Deltaproteobacteria bacterium]